MATYPASSKKENFRVLIIIIIDITVPPRAHTFEEEALRCSHLRVVVEGSDGCVRVSRGDR